MRTRALSSKLLCVLAAVFFSCGTAFAAEYIERTLMGNTIPAQKCAVKDEASQKATDKYTIDKFTRRFCETQGYGWYVSEAKDQGKLVCEECSGDASGAGKYRCHVEDIVVACKRLKPGSVGLFPGEG
ncbi:MULTISPECIES: hypothetical protein [Methylocaldum]|jgi:hypothetical protein|uniref:hypothetical protein n=1 Tax=unclassified Methylocaldum TaxID=2622260 RepID=UPI0010E22A49|nr:hypothetical protein [Methylocaldum sp. RMAD-M]MBP1150247.1 hypothetical protein [Methylocaldum sp. RMAD-M]